MPGMKRYSPNALSLPHALLSVVDQVRESLDVVSSEIGLKLHRGDKILSSREGSSGGGNRHPERDGLCRRCSSLQRWQRDASLRGAQDPAQARSAQARTCAPWDVGESDKIEEKQLATWIKQAASIRGRDGGSTRYGGSTVRARSGSDFLYYVRER